MAMKSFSNKSLQGSSDVRRRAGIIRRNLPNILQSSSSNVSNKNSVSKKELTRPNTPSVKQEPEENEDSIHNENNCAPSASSQMQGMTRVRSHARSLRAMANPSAVWAHFDLCSNDPLRAQCRLCGTVVVRGGANPRQCGTTNLHRHLRVHHGGRLVGRRYQVLSELKREQDQLTETPTSKALRIASQSLIRKMRTVPTISSKDHREKKSPSILQHSRPTAKTLVLKTIPLKAKQSNINPLTSAIKRELHPPLPDSQNFPHAASMPPPQQPAEVCLRWNSYHSNMQSSFPSLLDSEQFVDVTLACEGRSLKCHKMILSSCSEYLAQLLRENPCQHPIIIMKDLKFWEVDALVKFMYKGEVNVAHDKLPELLNAAEALQVKGLAGPTHTQNSKPPMLIPQSKKLLSQQKISQIMPRFSLSEGVRENSPKKSMIAARSNLKGPLKRPSSFDPLEKMQFNKIKLSQPESQKNDYEVPHIKIEPVDFPVSPPMNYEDDEDNSSLSNCDNTIERDTENAVNDEDAEMESDGENTSDQDNCAQDEYVAYSKRKKLIEENDDENNQDNFADSDYVDGDQNLIENHDDGSANSQDNSNDRESDDEPAMIIKAG